MHKIKPLDTLILAAAKQGQSSTKFVIKTRVCVAISTDARNGLRRNHISTQSEGITPQNTKACMQYEFASKRLVDYKSLEYLYKKLTYLAEVRRGYSFIYPVRGYDHCHLWYLIRAGEVADVIPAPVCEETFGAVRERIEDWSAQTRNPFDRGHGRHGHTLNLVASWFRNNRQELDTTFPPHQAAQRLAGQRQVGIDLC